MTADVAALRSPAPAAPAVEALMRPKSIAVLGASARRRALGNQVLRNLTDFGYGGSVTAVHRDRDVLEGWPAVPRVAELPEDLDVAVVSLPAASAIEMLPILDEHGCRVAVVPTAGFTVTEQRALQQKCLQWQMSVNGPNCLGVLSAADSAPMWTARIRRDFPVGDVAIVSQSGSAAIAVTSTPGLGFSRVVSTGNEYSLTTAAYLEWLADDAASAAVGVVMESLKDPDHFAEAVRKMRAAGKAVVVVKVGRSDVGRRATIAHSGALVTGYDVYAAYFRELGVPVVSDYDELVGALQVAVRHRSAPRGRQRVGVIAISGGQAALTADLAAETGTSLSEFSPETAEAIVAALPGATGENPVDIGACVQEDRRRVEDALHAVVDDPAVDSLLYVQDAQASLPLSQEHEYVTQAELVVRVSRTTSKPVVIASGSSAGTHPLLEGVVSGSSVCIVRGIRQGLIALRSLGSVPGDEDSYSRADHRPAAAEELRREIAGRAGVLPHDLVRRVLEAYELPLARAAVAVDEASALAAARDIGYPVVIKVASTQIPHRMDVGGIVTGVADDASVGNAVRVITERVRAAVPGCVISGFEVQEEIDGGVEVLLGFNDATPFGSAIVVGSGGTLAELSRERVIRIAPVSLETARSMISETMIGQVLAGYRRYIPETDIAPLARALRQLSLLAADLGDVIAEADLNPAFVAPVSGEIKIVDALLVGRQRDTSVQRADGPTSAK